MIERLQNKTLLIHHNLEREQNNWELVFYHHLAMNFGFKTN